MRRRLWPLAGYCGAAGVSAVLGIGMAAAQSQPNAPVLEPDRIIQSAGSSTHIDVLANDSLSSGSGRTLEVITQPQCGEATALEGWLTYQSRTDCEGIQVFYYGIKGSPAFAEVTVVVEEAKPQPEYTAGMAVIEKDPEPAAKAEQQANANSGTASGDGSAAGVIVPADPQLPARLEPVMLPRQLAAPATAGPALVVPTEVAAKAEPAATVAAAEAPAAKAPEVKVPEIKVPEVNVEAKPAVKAVEPVKVATAAAAPAKPAETAADGTKVASLTDATAPTGCAAQAVIDTRAEPGALTMLGIEAPCAAGSVARVDYAGLHIAVEVDASGTGRIMLPGFEPTMPASLHMADGSARDLTLEFSGFERIERIAAAWSDPVLFTLNALELGAAPGSKGHVGPANKRSFADVRSSGGGFLTSFMPVSGIGDSVQVYTYVTADAGRPGVVQVLLDYTSRKLGDPSACGTGKLAAPQVMVLESRHGKLAGPQTHSPKAVTCAQAGLDARLGDPVGTVVVR